MAYSDYVSLGKDFLLATIGPASAIISAWLTHRYDERRFEKERRDRMMAELISIRRKALQDVNAAMVDCHFRSNLYGNAPPGTLQTFNQEVSGPVQKFEDTLNVNSIWYTRDLLDKLNKVRGAFRQVKFAIYLSLPTQQLPAGINPQNYPPAITNIDWQGFSESFSEASEQIRQNLGIPSLEKYMETLLKR